MAGCNPPIITPESMPLAAGHVYPPMFADMREVAVSSTSRIVAVVNYRTNLEVL
jgi:hypothetical protein